MSAPPFDPRATITNYVRFGRERTCGQLCAEIVGGPNLEREREFFEAFKGLVADGRIVEVRVPNSRYPVVRLGPAAR